MPSGLLGIVGTIDLTQLWPPGTADADTSKVKVTVGANAFRFRKNQNAPFVATHVFDNATVRGKTTKPAIDKEHRVTVRLQAVDAPELHYRPPAEVKAAKQSAQQRKLYLEWDLDVDPEERFDVNTQSLLAAIDRTTNLDAGVTINMHQAVAGQTNPAKRFITVPWATAFEHGADEGWVVSAASDIVVKVAVEASTGAPAVQNDPADPTRVLQIPTGKNPRGIVVNPNDTRAYVMSYVSRDVTVIDLTVAPEQVIDTMKSERVPKGPRLEAMIHLAKELYNTSIGTFDPPARGQPPVAGRMSANGWGSCASCHPFGLSDNVVWIFASGPRRTIPQHADFDPTDPERLVQRALDWSAIFDEEADFELNIRNVSGGEGLIVQADGVTPEPAVDAFDPVNTGRPQLKVRGARAWDALEAFVKFGIRTPISPASDTDPDVIAGRALFIAANCQQCHGGPQWTSSRVRFTPPPSPGLVVNGQIISELRNVGTFDPSFVNEVRANAVPPLGAAGFAPASLLSVFAFPQTFQHNGTAGSLDAVLLNVTHRSAGTGGVDTLTNAADRAKIVRFLESIDGGTAPINF